MTTTKAELIRSGLWQALWLVLLAAALTTIGGILAVQAILPDNIPRWDKTSWLYCIAYVGVSYLANLAAAGTLYALAYLFIRRWNNEAFEEAARAAIVAPITRYIDEYVVEKEVLLAGDVPWRSYITTASAIDICVHEWDGWVDANEKPFREVFEKGGTVNLFLPSDDAAHLGNIAVIADRLDRNVEKHLTQLKSTWEKLRKLRVGTPGRLNVYLTEAMIWFCAVRFDRKTIIVSLFENRPKRGSNEAAAAEPVWIDAHTYRLSEARHATALTWFEREFAELQRRAKHIPFPET